MGKRGSCAETKESVLGGNEHSTASVKPTAAAIIAVPLTERKTSLSLSSS